MDWPFNTVYGPSVCGIGVAGPWDWMWTINATFATSTAWPTANEIWYTPLYVETPVVARQMSWLNGATASGNINVGLYTESGVRLVQQTAIAQTGVSTIQFANIADTVLMPGTYFAAIQGSATTLTFLMNTQSAYRWRSCGAALEAAGSFALPAQATFASFTKNGMLFLQTHMHSVA
jgi:hypothetical protein